MLAQLAVPALDETDVNADYSWYFRVGAVAFSWSLAGLVGGLMIGFVIPSEMLRFACAGSSTAFAAFAGGSLEAEHWGCTTEETASDYFESSYTR